MKLFQSLDQTAAQFIEKTVGTPAYLYDETTLESACADVLDFPHPFGLTARFAVKACPNAAILKRFDKAGLHFDASSLPEVERIAAAGIAVEKISLSSQELAPDFPEWVRRGLTVNACSLAQLRRYGKAFPGGKVGLRFNPGLGSGHTGKTNVGGPSSSFGIWHEQLPEVRKILEEFKLTAFRVHTHIGSGSDPAVWQRVADLSLELVRQIPSVTHINMGGGYKVARMPDEKGTVLSVVAAPVKETLAKFAEETGRRLHLEIEPGTYLVAKAGSILTRIQDETNTGPDGFHFLKLNAGMTEILRPSLYGAQHPMRVIPERSDEPALAYVVVGHCCESGDLLTPKPDDSEALNPRTLSRATIGDWLLIGGAGAYCSAMAAKNYNSFPEAPEVLWRKDGSWELIRRRQPLSSIWAQETEEPL
jgi:diaminopimelate decarboxylase